MGNSSSQEGGVPPSQGHVGPTSPSTPLSPNQSGNTSSTSQGSSKSKHSNDHPYNHHHARIPRIHHRQTASRDGTNSSEVTSPVSPVAPPPIAPSSDYGARLNKDLPSETSTLSPSYNNEKTEATLENTAMNSNNSQGFDSPTHVEYIEDTNDSVTQTQTHTSTGSEALSGMSATATSTNTGTRHIDNSMSTQNSENINSMSSNSEVTQEGSRPGPLRRKSTLLLQGEVDPEFDEDMEFNKLNIATGEPVGKPLSRAGSGDEIQLGNEEAAVSKYDTVIIWNQGGNKVYVTGTFTGWRKMIKLNKQPDGYYSIVLRLPAGPHRMRFVVDNELRCSDFLPSATDSMGNLVNYIEVSPDTQQQADNALRPPHDPLYTNSMASVQTAATNDDDMEPIHRTSGNHDTQQQNTDPNTLSSENPSYRQPYDNSGQIARLKRATTVEKVTNYDMSNDDELLNGGGYERFQEELPSAPVYTYSSQIPTVFTDPEATDKFVSSEFVTPPQLPPHLEAVILNSNSNEKDNNSVLPIPNHVVLNHLATTSIKHNVLAVATVSRYSRKYVTQILYAPL